MSYVYKLKPRMTVLFLAAAVLLTVVLYVVVGAERAQATLKINEVAFNQKSGIDWIEIYNPTARNFSLRNLYLSDDEKDLEKFMLEDLVIEAKGFLVFYGEDYEGDTLPSTVLNFRVSNGETVYLTSLDGKSVIDSLVLVNEEDQDDETIGRYPDGGDDVFLMSNFTPGAANLIEETVEEEIPYADIFVEDTLKTIQITISKENLEIMGDYDQGGGGGGRPAMGGGERRERPEVPVKGMEPPEPLEEGMEMPEGFEEGMERPKPLENGMEPPEGFEEGMERPEGVAENFAEGDKPVVASASSSEPEYVSAEIEFGGVTYENVAIRYKGNSSLNNGTKKPYRIDLNKYEDNQTMSGLQEFVLNPNYKDPSQVREALSYAIMREEGIPAEYTAFVEVYVNEEYLGLYTMVENVDEDFLERNFGNSDGLLIKAGDSGTGLEYIDDNPDSYANDFDVKSGSDEEVLAFLDFLEFINSDLDESDKQQILEQLDVYGALDYFAMLVVQTSMDSYLGVNSGRNFYLYFDTDVQKYKFIPWDMNESFGTYSGTAANLSWDVTNPLSASSGSESRGGGNQTGGRPLFEKLYEIEEFKEYYLQQVEYYASEVVALESLEEEINTLSALVIESQDSGESSELKAFIEERMTVILGQLEGD